MPSHRLSYATLSCLPLSCLLALSSQTLLGLDLAIVLDSNLVVRLQRRDGVVGDLGTVKVLVDGFD
jgi:hypothetical protein